MGMPQSFEELKLCMKADKCGYFDEHNPAGDSTTDFDRWFEQPEHEVRKINCFKSDRYEPYLVLRHCPTTPRYDERFVGYGKNKIQHINHVRFLGFQFSVVPHSFVLHFPHPTSSAKEKWLGNKKNVHKEQDERYREWYEWLKAEVGYTRMTTKLCENVR